MNARLGAANNRYEVTDKFDGDWVVWGDYIRVDDDIVSICRGEPGESILNVVASFHQPAGIAESDEVADGDE